jgi:Cu+-exporting ATPase
LVVAEVKDFNSIPGRGVQGKVDGHLVLLGNTGFMAAQGIDTSELRHASEDLAEAGKTPMYVAVDGVASGIVAVADTVKESSAAAIARLREMGIKTIMITGDNERTARAIAQQVGIDEAVAEVLPDEKAAKVRELQDQGQIVAMVGDGVNDAPALAQAHVGIAIGSGTDVAKETGDIILMRGDLRDVVTAIETGRATMRKVRQNLLWAFFYNAVGIPIAAGLLYPFTGQLVSPELAAFFMAVSSVSVTLNTLTLRRFRPKFVKGGRVAQQTTV